MKKSRKYGANMSKSSFDNTGNDPGYVQDNFS